MKIKLLTDNIISMELKANPRMLEMIANAAKIRDYADEMAGVVMKNKDADFNEYPLKGWHDIQISANSIVCDMCQLLGDDIINQTFDEA